MESSWQHWLLTWAFMSAPRIAGDKPNISWGGEQPQGSLVWCKISQKYANFLCRTRKKKANNRETMGSFSFSWRKNTVCHSLTPYYVLFGFSTPKPITQAKVIGSVLYYCIIFKVFSQLNLTFENALLLFLMVQQNGMKNANCSNI